MVLSSGIIKIGIDALLFIQTEELILISAAIVVMVGIPTAGMYFRATEDDTDRVFLLTGVMLVTSILIPIIGPIVLWIGYALVTE
ncbi:hypothetical protein Natpe_0027 [Natrinema pellirubrum DSM 15624]|uniref:Uncharacterized protein n=1 Tax=Natrinema pellirubrum (strain DSM 15624 / CIP 106293 / JCM 10476 / NCIMB 786 / 157) TaxID=797303 RepID=L0JGJ7_NATP1|nr:hypothetical protein Natpe_0027 [Natrinema pellirubrum DSM 15624]